jgi:hypothetical protein
MTEEEFFLRHRAHSSSEYWGCLTQGLRQPELKPNNLPLSTADFRMCGALSVSPYAFKG